VVERCGYCPAAKHYKKKEEALENEDWLRTPGPRKKGKNEGVRSGKKKGQKKIVERSRGLPQGERWGRRRPNLGTTAAW